MWLARRRTAKRKFKACVQCVGNAFPPHNCMYCGKSTGENIPKSRLMKRCTFLPMARLIFLLSGLFLRVPYAVVIGCAYSQSGVDIVRFRWTRKGLLEAAYLKRYARETVISCAGALTSHQCFVEASHFPKLSRIARYVSAVISRYTPSRTTDRSILESKSSCSNCNGVVFVPPPQTT